MKDEHGVEYRWRNCETHPDVDGRYMWGCPDCLAELRAEVGRLTSENDRLTSEKDQFESKSKGYLESLNIQEARLRDLRINFKETQVRVDNLGKELEAAHSLAVEISDARDSIRAERDNYCNQLSVVEGQKRALETKVQDLRGKLENIRVEFDNFWRSVWGPDEKRPE